MLQDESGDVMYKTLYAMLTIIWILDIVNFPGFEILDITYPIIFWIWLLIWIFLPSCKDIRKVEKDNK